MVTGRCRKETYFWEGEGVTKVGWKEVDRAWSVVSSWSQNAYLALVTLGRCYTGAGSQELALNKEWEVEARRSVILVKERRRGRMSICSSTEVKLELMMRTFLGS